MKNGDDPSLAINQWQKGYTIYEPCSPLFSDFPMVPQNLEIKYMCRLQSGITICVATRLSRKCHTRTLLGGFNPSSPRWNKKHDTLKHKSCRTHPTFLLQKIRPSASKRASQRSRSLSAKRVPHWTLPEIVWLVLCLPL